MVAFLSPGTCAGAIAGVERWIVGAPVGEGQRARRGVVRVRLGVR